MEVITLVLNKHNMKLTIAEIENDLKMTKEREITKNFNL